MYTSNIKGFLFSGLLLIGIYQSGECQSISIPSGGSIAITGAATIEINNGDFINNGTYTKGSETVTFSGITAKSMSGSSSTVMNNISVTNTGGITDQLGSLTINNLSIAVSCKFTIDPAKAVTATSITNSAGSTGLLVKSGIAGSGSLILGNTGVSASLERYMTKGVWHVISIPVSGQLIGSFVSNSANSIGYNASATDWGMMPYDPTNNLWGAFFKTANVSTFNIGEGYMVRRKSGGADGVVTASGDLQSGNVNRNVVSGKWNAIGNPYSSAIGVKTISASTDKFLTVNSSNLDASYAAIYIWDEQAGYAGPSRSDYKVISNSGYSPELSKNYLQVGQGFMVKTAAAATTVNFTAAMQTHQVTETYLKKSDVSWPGFELVASGSTNSINTIVCFDENMTIGLDPSFDAGVLKGNPSLALYTRLMEDNGLGFAIQCLPLNGIEEFIIPVGIDYPSGGELVFTAKTELIPFGSAVILEDRLLGTFTNLVSYPAGYTVNLSPSTSGTGRFYLHTSDAQVSNLPVSNKILQVYASGQKIYINGEVSANAIFSLYSIQGVLFKEFISNGSLNQQLDAVDLKDGVYLLRISDGLQNRTYKLFIGY